MGVSINEGSIRNAAARLLTPSPEKQGEQVELEQESPEEETLEAQEQEVTDDVEESDQLDYEEEEVGDSEKEESADEEEEEPVSESEDDDGDKYYTVKVDGEEFEVNLPELIKGYQLEQNYTKKSQQLAEQQKELAALKESLQAERDKYLQVNAQLVQQGHAELEQAKAKLNAIDRSDDPIGYAEAWADLKAMEENLVKQKADYEAAMTEAQREQHERLQHYITEQQKQLTQILPEWNDPNKGAELKKQIATFALNQGYTEQELGNVVNARDILVLNKARLYDEMVGKKEKIRAKRAPEKAKPKIKAAVPKSEQTKKARAIKAQREQAKRSGSVKDTANLLENLFKSKRN